MCTGNVVLIKYYLNSLINKIQYIGAIMPLMGILLDIMYIFLYY